MTQTIPDQLRQAAQLIQQGQKQEALPIIKAVLVQDRHNVQAWWLGALAAPDAAEARTALHVVLKLQPDHAQARTLLAQLDAAAPPSPTPARYPAPPQIARAPVTQIKPPMRPTHRSTPRWRRNLVTLTLIGLGVMVLGGSALLFILNLMGSPLTDQLAVVLANDTTTATPEALAIAHGAQIQSVMPANEIRTYRFQGQANTELFVGLGLVTVPSSADTTGVMELIDPDGYRVARSSAEIDAFELPNLPILDSGNVSVIHLQLDRTGTWSLRLIGEEGRCAGAYVLIMQCYPESGCRAPRQLNRAS